MTPLVQPPSFWRDAPRRLLRILQRLLGWLLALVILFEEWGWEPLQRVLAAIGRWPGLRWIERRVTALPPYAALALFAGPAVLLLPVKLSALWLIGRGHYLGGMAVIVVAKIAGTAIVARLFTLTQPALLRLAWFARVHARWTVWKEALLARVRASWPWRQARVLKRQWRLRWRAWRRR